MVRLSSYTTFRTHTNTVTPIRHSRARWYELISKFSRSKYALGRLRVCVRAVRRGQRRHTFQKIISSRTNMLTHSSFEREIHIFLCKNGIAGNIVGLTETERMVVLLWCCCYDTYSKMRAQFSFRFISWLNTVEIIIRLPYVSTCTLVSCNCAAV